jgi:hypothetical protein
MKAMTDDDVERENSDIVLRGRRIATDANGYPCLNDMWRLAGEPENKRAKDWQRGKRSKALHAALHERIGEISPTLPKTTGDSLCYSIGRGRGANTFAHPVLALDYAEYLDPSLAVEVRETFLRVRAGDVSIALEILDGMAEQAEYDETRVKLREMLKEHNKLSAGVARDAGVRNFEVYNGAGLSGLYGGMSKASLLKHKGLPDDADRLDHCGHEELAANYFKATQAIAKIKRDGIKGQDAANKAHLEVGAAVRQTIREIGGTMPEDEPAIENIKEAEKRLKIAKEVTKKLPSRPAK